MLKFISKILLSLMFIISVIKNLTGGFSGSVKYIASKNLPLPTLLAIGGLIVKSLGVFSLLTGKLKKYFLPLLIVFMITVMIVFNNPIEDSKNLWKFLSLVGVVGGILYVLADN